jgi:hypothetical protein
MSTYIIFVLLFSTEKYVHMNFGKKGRKTFLAIFSQTNLVNLAYIWLISWGNVGSYA